MRELKFRTYDFVMQRYDDAPEMYITTDGHLKPSCNRIAEQYTGLKDTNGNEIYEGDILEDGSGEPFEYWIVKFENGKFIGSTQGTDEDIYELTDLEVIGDIHENPELLEEE